MQSEAGGLYRKALPSFGSPEGAGRSELIHSEEGACRLWTGHVHHPPSHSSFLFLVLKMLSDAPPPTLSTVLATRGHKNPCCQGIYGKVRKKGLNTNG